LADLSGSSKDRRKATRQRTQGQVADVPAKVTSSEDIAEPEEIAKVKSWLHFLKIPGRFHRIPIALVVVVLLAGFAFIGWGWLRPPIAWTYHQLPFIVKINKMDSALNDKRAGLPAIADKLDRSQKQLIAIESFLTAKFPEFGNVLLKDAENAARNGDMSNAAVLLQMVATGLSDAPIETAPSAKFFPAALETLDRVEGASSNPELALLAFRTRVALAVYNSRLQPQPQLPTNRPLNISGTLVTAAEAFSLKGRQINWMGHAGGEFFRLPRAPEAGALSATLADMTLVGGWQTLDGIGWVNVIFVNCVIRYKNGPLYLEDVRFVNCKFETQPSKPARQFLNYAVVGKGPLKLG
jgi:hypothetical protein